MEAIVIDFSVDDTPASVGQLMLRLQPLFAIELAARPATTELLVDLSGCGYLGPTAVVVLTAIRRRLASLGIRLALRAPTLERLSNYCRYSGLYREFEEGPNPDPDHRRNATRPVHVFAKAIPRAEIEGLADLAKASMRLGATAEDDLKLCLSEVMQNVLDHSQSSIGGVLSGRAFGEKREMRFAVADLGVGFRGGLASKHDVSSDLEALRLVIEQHVTSGSQSHNMGEGLRHLHHIVRLTNGRLVIASGGACLDVLKSRNKFSVLDANFPGTLVFVRLPIRQDPEGDVEELSGSFWASG